MVDALCCGEWCRKYFGKWVGFDILWGFVRSFVKTGRFVYKNSVGLSCEEDDFL